jgi:predicted DNA binding CopG/RHH family protein
MERTMKTKKLPKTDSIRELARFWDSHDLTDFADELEEVREPVFAEDASIRLKLPSRNTRAVRRIAESKGISEAELVRQWVLEKLKPQKRHSNPNG